MLKHTLVLGLIAVTLMFFTLFFAYAHAGEPEQSGFSGTIALGGAWESADPDLADASDDDNRMIQSLNQSSKSTSRFIPVLFGDLSYTLAASGTCFSIGTMGDAPGLNISQPLGKTGVLSIGAGYQENDVWADPFITGSHRGKTDETTKSFQIGMDDILETGLMIGYTFDHIKVDNDLAGGRNPVLRREGNVHTINAGLNLISNDTHELYSELSYLTGDMKGECNSFKGWAACVGYTLIQERWKLETAISATFLDYDAIHPEFNKKREDKMVEVSGAYTLFDPFGMENYFVTCFASYGTTNANIRFYDSSCITTGMAVGYSF